MESHEPGEIASRGTGERAASERSDRASEPSGPTRVADAAFDEALEAVFGERAAALRTLTT